MESTVGHCSSIPVSHSDDICKDDKVLETHPESQRSRSSRFVTDAPSENGTLRSSRTLAHSRASSSVTKKCAGLIEEKHAHEEGLNEDSDDVHVTLKKILAALQQDSSDRRSFQEDRMIESSKMRKRARDLHFQSLNIATMIAVFLASLDISIISLARDICNTTQGDLTATNQRYVYIWLTGAFLAALIAATMSGFHSIGVLRASEDRIMVWEVSIAPVAATMLVSVIATVAGTFLLIDITLGSKRGLVSVVIAVSVLIALLFLPHLIYYLRGLHRCMLQTCHASGEV